MQQGAKMACPYLFLLIAWKVFWLPSFSDSLILNILKIMFLSIENYKNKSRHNKDVVYKYAIFNYETFSIVGFTKITNLIKFVDLKIYILNLHVSHFV
jgi:hypothetical protein